MIEEDAAGRLNGEDLEHLQRIRSAAQRMAQLVDDLLGLSRVSRQDLLRVPVDVSALCAEVAGELRAGDPARRVDVSIAPSMTANADAALLRVILYHLLDNAWKFTAKHDQARIEVGATDVGEERVFFVRDDGAGFDPRYAEHLFGAFQRLHPATEFPGDGTGLETVQRLVIRHGGRLWAESAVEQGAAFFFTLQPQAG
jgi:light-regulated signal transduction histidine kinase (bacteriophytochrome)